MDYVAVSCGIGRADMENVEKITTALPDLKFICIDVANGYSNAQEARNAPFCSSLPRRNFKPLFKRIPL
jgi:hypothetical protein